MHWLQAAWVCLGIPPRKSHSFQDIYNGRDNGLLMNQSAGMAPGELAVSHGQPGVRDVLGSAAAGERSESCPSSPATPVISAEGPTAASSSYRGSSLFNL